MQLRRVLMRVVCDTDALRSILSPLARLLESVGSIQIDAVSRFCVGGRDSGSSLLRADIKSIAAPRRSSLRHWAWTHPHTSRRCVHTERSRALLDEPYAPSSSTDLERPMR